MGMAETNVMRRWLLKNAGFAKLFRTQSAGLWAGQPIKEWEGVDENGRMMKFVTLKAASRVQVGFKGISDHTGWKKMIITPDMVGKPVAVFCAVEAKKDDNAKVTEEQAQFLHNVRKDGGIAFVVRSEDTIPSGWEPAQ